MNMKSNLAHEPPIPQGQVVHFPKNERKAMSHKESLNFKNIAVSKNAIRLCHVFVIWKSLA